ncbi:hypothetical protein KEM52_001363 [Ascosphaera acerosa]|nr:hypothetical protein KEM52_001363 [Ascosphaera acerosa]
MDTSPLTQQARPESFQPKIVQLYQQLFRKPSAYDGALFVPSEGFWRECFLLRPDGPELGRAIDALTPSEMLQIQTTTQSLFSRAVRDCASRNTLAQSNALETIVVFLNHALSQKYTNPSSDIIAVLAGLDNVDAVMPDFVAALDGLIRSDGKDARVRRNAVRAAIAMVSGGYKTSLLSYFMHRDLFPSLMKYINDSSPAHTFEPFLLLGLLANCNKFEFQNPYQLRLNDFVNETTIKKVAAGAAATCAALRDAYLAVQDDAPEGWSITSLLGFGRGKEKQLTPEEVRERFSSLPLNEAAILLAIYDFVNSNKLFGYTFVTASATSDKKGAEESPFATYLSLTSYLLHHAYRTERASLYAEVNLFALRVMVEDPVLCKQICSDSSKRPVRLCRQKAPFLPLVKGDRVLATVIIDILVDAMNHNLRRSLDSNLYCHTISILFRLFTYLSSNRTRLAYHYSHLWRTLLNLVRFMTTYSADLLRTSHISTLASSLTDLITFCISVGDTFLPDPASYDDLYYKVVEAGQTLQTFNSIYKPSSSVGERARSEEPIETLLRVAGHFNSLLFMPDKDKQPRAPSPGPGAASPAGRNTPDSTAGTISRPTSTSARKKHLSPSQVHEIIKQGYDTLSIQAAEELSTWERWREGDWRTELKRTARIAVDDAKAWVVRESERRKDAGASSGGAG